MNVKETTFRGLFVIEPTVFEDQRGSFMESFNSRALSKAIGQELTFVQDNQSRSVLGVLRGLHFQSAPHAQTKMIRVLRGAVLDIVVDLRREEPTFGQVYSNVLSEENRRQLLVPKGFAHGFEVISEMADVFYKCDDYYYPQSEGGINFLDKDLGIKAILKGREHILSEKDKALPDLRNSNFRF